jgi:hypothetical protein
MHNLAFLVAKTEEDAGIWITFKHNEVAYDCCLRGWYESEFRIGSVKEDLEADDVFSSLKCLPLHTLL